MIRLSSEQLKAYLDPMKILVGKPHHPRILITSDNRIVKLFYKRKRFSTSTFFPQALRFQKNSQRLTQFDVRAPLVQEILHCPERSIHLAVYDNIPGTDYRELCQTENTEVLAQLPPFLNSLHDKGIYFRAIHLGNLIHCDDDAIALVDISDLKIKHAPLNAPLRARNLLHLINTESDIDFFRMFGIERFIDSYLGQSTLGSWGKRYIKRQFISAVNDV
ncbi:MAG: hypothetical protein OEZ23_00855 [Gammaproteobacteria bacterium]|nr:hypothetical protein [Gammaproteobacteria bacterium]